jgi:ATP phosphoribosyltransferase
MKFKLGIPQGSLQAPLIHLFRRAGFGIRAPEDSYFPSIDDPEIECLLIKAQEMPRYVSEKLVDAGVTGDDWIKEYAATANTESIKTVADLVCPAFGLGPMKWVLAVPERSAFATFRDLDGQTISTELVEVTKSWFADSGVNVRVTFSWGATELKAPTLAAAIVQPEIADSHLRTHGLKAIDTIIESHPRLIAHRSALTEESPTRTKLEQIALLLKAAVAANDKVRLIIEARREHAADIIALIPTVLPASVIGEGDHVTISVVARETSIRDLMPRLKAAGAERVVESPLNKIVL